MSSLPAPDERIEQRLKTIVPMLIAAVTILSAFTGWRANAAAGSAGGADSTGLAAALDAEQARVLNNANLYQHYQAWTEFALNKALGDAIKQNLLQRYDGQKLPADPADAAKLSAYVQDQELLRDQAYDAAGVSQYFFVTRYLAPDGTYNTRREIDETTADAARLHDLNPAAHFAQADRQRARTAGLVGILMVFALAVLMFTISVEGARGRARYVFVSIGLGLMGIGAIAVLLIEAGVLMQA